MQQRVRRLMPLWLPAVCGMATKPLEGRLYRYRSSPGSLQAFESGPAATSWFAIYVGGLTDGLLACPYVEALAHECDSRGWPLVQPILSSSYAGYGTGSLERDVEELSTLARHLAAERGATSLVLIGHSTGCQDAVHFMATAQAEVRSLVRGVVLQAPVSDRESAALEGGATERAAQLERAERLCAAGRGDEVLCLQHGFVPLSTSRFASLVGRGGPDDMFSSDLSDAELRGRLGHLSAPGLTTLFAHSMADEYVPRSVDVELLSRRLVAAAGGSASASRLLLSGAKHNLESPSGEAARQFLQGVGDILKGVGE